MEDDILAQIDKELTTIGSDKIWKRRIGGIELWFSPLGFDHSVKIQEILLDPNMGNSALKESKKLTIASSVVGIGDIDLSGYRFDGKKFSIPGRDGKREFVDLVGYIRKKMGNWSEDFIDIAFDVLADLMESYRKDLLKDVKFENVKDPREELIELESKAAILRQQLNLPPLSELSPSRDGDGFTEQDRESLESETEDSPPVPEINVEPEFDPFKSLEIPKADNVSTPTPPSVHPASPSLSSVGHSNPVPKNNILVDDIPDEIRSRLSATPVSALDPENMIIDQPASKVPPSLPRIDQSPSHQSKNPRFHKPIR